MSFRLLAAGLLALALAVPAFADEPKPSSAPAFALKVKSFEALLAAAKHVAAHAGKEAPINHLEGLLGAFKTDKGVGGIDPSKPWAAYGTVSGSVMASPVVILVPISDEAAFLNLLGAYNLKPKKDTDGVYTIEELPVGLPVPISAHFRFAHGHAYITVLDRDHIAPAKLLKPDEVLALAGDAPLASLLLRVDRVPDLLKQIAMGQIENRLAAYKMPAGDDESKALTAIRVQAVDELSKTIKRVLNDGQEARLKLGLDPKTDDVTADLTVQPKPGSHLAKDVSALADRPAAFGAWADGTAALSATLALGLPDELNKALAPLIDEAIKERVEREGDDLRRGLLKKLLVSLAPTLKAGTADAGVKLTGPDDKGLYTGLVGLRLEKGQGIEAALRLIHEVLPEGVQGLIRLDTCEAGGAKVHRGDIGDQLDPGLKRAFGEGPVFVAVRDDAAVLALGPGAEAAVKAAVAAKPKAGPPLSATLSIARIMPLNEDDPKGRKIVKEMFGSGDPKGSDTVSARLAGGEVLRATVTVKGKVLGAIVRAQTEKDAAE